MSSAEKFIQQANFTIFLSRSFKYSIYLNHFQLLKKFLNHFSLNYHDLCIVITIEHFYIVPITPQYIFSERLANHPLSLIVFPILPLAQSVSRHSL